MSRRKTLLAVLLVVALTLMGFFAVEQIHESTLVFATRWTGIGDPRGVAMGDYNNDGLNEIAWTDFSGGSVKVGKSDGTTIIKEWLGLSSPNDVAIGDYDGDGLNDIAFSENWDGKGVTVYKSDGTTIIRQFPTPFGASGVAIGDYDNDGLNEIAFAEDPVSRFGNVTVFENNGTQIKQWTNIYMPRGLAIGDYDNDGLNEIVIAEPMAGKVTVYKSDGVTIVKQWFDFSLSVNWVEIGDYDNDGLNEIVMSDSNWVTVYKSDGITVVAKWTLVGVAEGVAIGDYNNDQLNDIAYADSNFHTLTVYYQTKPGMVSRSAEPTIVTLRGTLTDSSGYPIVSGSTRVTIKDSLGVQVWQDVFDNCIDNGKYNLPLGTKTPLKLIKGRIYSAILEVDAYSATFVSTDVTFGDNNPVGDLIKFVAD